MNIFYLDKDPRICAEYHCDKHVVKMIVESAQLLSCAHRVLDGTETLTQKQITGSSPARFRKQKIWVLNDFRENAIYKTSHVKHPSAIWARSNIDHYRYLYDLFAYLISEYKYRYKGKDHKCELLLGPLLNAPNNIDYEAPWSEPPQAMPEDCKVQNNSIRAYRNYYVKYKQHFAKWTGRPVPEWYLKETQP
jgi:hypothetical protein